MRRFDGREWARADGEEQSIEADGEDRAQRMRSPQNGSVIAVERAKEGLVHWYLAARSAR